MKPHDIVRMIDDRIRRALTANSAATASQLEQVTRTVMARTDSLPTLHALDPSGNYHTGTLDEADVVFDGTSGHAHTGATQGKVLDHGTALTGLGDDDHVQYLLAAGTRALTGNWDAGNFEVRSRTFQSDVATGTAPFIVVSSTVVSNLNADYLDGSHASAFAGSSHSHVKGDLPAAVAYEDEANAFILVNYFKDVELDDQDATPVADRRLRTTNGLIRATTTAQVEGRYISKVSIEQIDHGADLLGLADDDHTQYLNVARHDLTARHPLGTVVPHDDHGALSGLTDDDHSQYAQLAGRSGGQTLIGGTAAGNDLRIQSTSNATKGTIFFGAGSTVVFDEVNSRFGVGVASPDGPVDANGGYWFRERSANPTSPDEGCAILWMSDGVGQGADGDCYLTVTAGAVTKHLKVGDFAAGNLKVATGLALLDSNGDALNVTHGLGAVSVGLTLSFQSYTDSYPVVWYIGGSSDNLHAVDNSDGTLTIYGSSAHASTYIRWWAIASS